MVLVVAVALVNGIGIACGVPGATLKFFQSSRNWKTSGSRCLLMCCQKRSIRWEVDSHHRTVTNVPLLFPFLLWHSPLSSSSISPEDVVLEALVTESSSSFASIFFMVVVAAVVVVTVVVVVTAAIVVVFTYKLLG